MTVIPVMGRPGALALAPGSPEWSRRITASKVATILGVSPYESPYSIWQQMKGNVEKAPSNEVQARGHYLEPAILAWWQDQHRDLAVSWFQPSYRLGDWAAATPDAEAFIDCEHDHREECGKECLVLVEAKSAARDDEWGPPGTDAIPAYYLCQIYWQMHVSGIHRCYVPIITGRLRFMEYVVGHDPAIGADLEVRMRAFYDSLTSDTPPPLDNTVATFEVLKAMHKDIDYDVTAECRPAEAVEFIEASAELKAAERRDRAARSVVLEHMGRARYLAAEGVRVARRQPGKGGSVSLYQTATDTSLFTSSEEAS